MRTHRDLIILTACSLILSHPIAALYICDDCPDPLRFSSPGVGFDLTLNYGTAAVYFPNRTITSVAKIEGSSSYKHEMRNRMEESLRLYEEPGQISSIPRITTTKPSWAIKKLQFLSQALRCLRTTSTPAESPTTAMLRALKISTESFLSQELHFVEVAVPVHPPYSQDNQTHFLDTTLHSIELSRTNQRPTSASAAAARGYGIDHPNVDLEYILAVDYSRAGLMLTLDEVDMGVVEEKDRKWRDDLGSEALHEMSDYWKLVEDGFRDFVDGGGERKKVDYLVVIGDKVLVEPRMLEILKKVLGEDTYAKALIAPVGQSLDVDPVFAAAIAMAGMGRANIFESPEGCTYAGTCKGAGVLRDEL